MTIRFLRDSPNRSSLLPGFLFIALALALAWVALSPAARAECYDGCVTYSASTVLGDDALPDVLDGYGNTAVGADALYSNTFGSRNVAIGSSALFSNQTGGDNTATGVNALYYNTGDYNTATGYQATQSASTTRPTVGARSIATRTASTTRPTV